MQRLDVGKSELLPSKETVTLSSASGRVPNPSVLKVKWANALEQAAPAAGPLANGRFQPESIATKPESQSPLGKDAAEIVPPAESVSKETELLDVNRAGATAPQHSISAGNDGAEGINDSGDASAVARRSGSSKALAHHGQRKVAGTGTGEAAGIGSSLVAAAADPGLALYAGLPQEVAGVTSLPVSNPGTIRMPLEKNAATGQAGKALHPIVAASATSTTIQDGTIPTATSQKADKHHADSAGTAAISHALPAGSMADVRATGSLQNGTTQRTLENQVIATPPGEPKVDGSRTGHNISRTTTEEILPQTTPHALQVTASGPAELEVGVLDGTHGWLKIRAELNTSGTVDATLGANAAAHEHLRAAIPEMTVYLGTEAVKVNTIAMHRLDAGNANADGAGLSNTAGGGAREDQEQAGKSRMAASTSNSPGQEGSSLSGTAPAPGMPLPISMARMRWPFGMQGNNTGTWLSVCA